MIHSVFVIKLWGTQQILVTVNLKFKVKTYFCVSGAGTHLTPCFDTVPTWIKYIKSSFKKLSIQGIKLKYSKDLDKNPCGKGQVWSILERPVYITNTSVRCL